MAAKSIRLILSIFMAAGLLVALNATAGAQKATNAKTVAAHMDKSKYTSAEIKSYLKSLKGNPVTADGRINDIRTGRTGNRVVVFVDTPKSKDFVVDVYVDDINKLHIGDRVSCRGEYHKYNMFTVNGITLKNGRCSH